jgi:hypothetical protein
MVLAALRLHFNLLEEVFQPTRKRHGLESEPHYRDQDTPSKQEKNEICQ